MHFPLLVRELLASLFSSTLNVPLFSFYGSAYNISALLTSCFFVFVFCIALFILHCSYQISAEVMFLRRFKLSHLECEGAVSNIRLSYYETLQAA